MARTTRHSNIPRTSRKDVEGHNRTHIRQVLKGGRWDDEPLVMPTRVVRRPRLMS